MQCCCFGLSPYISAWMLSIPSRNAAKKWELQLNDKAKNKRIVDLGRKKFARPKDRLVRNGTEPKFNGVILYTATVIKVVLIVTCAFLPMFFFYVMFLLLLLLLFLLLLLSFLSRKKIIESKWRRRFILFLPLRLFGIQRTAQWTERMRWSEKKKARTFTVVSKQSGTYTLLLLHRAPPSHSLSLSISLMMHIIFTSKEIKFHYLSILSGEKTRGVFKPKNDDFDDESRK